MSIRFATLAASFLLLGLTALPLSAQEATVPVTYRLTAFGSGPLKSTSYSNSPTGPSTRVSKMHVTNPIEATLREGLFLDFFGDDPDPEGKPDFSLKISEAARRGDLLVLLMNNGKELKPVLLDLKALKIPDGGQYVFNLLKVPVAIQCGEKAKPITIPPGKTKSIAPPGDDKVIQTLYFADDDGKPRKFSSSIYFMDKTSRQLLFCFGEKGAKLPKAAPISIYNRPIPQEENP